MQIRDTDPEADADQVVELLLVTNPTIVTNAAEWLHRYRSVPERARLLSVVAEVDGRIVGAGGAGVIFFGGGGENGFLNLQVHPGPAAAGDRQRALRPPARAPARASA